MKEGGDGGAKTALRRRTPVAPVVEQPAEPALDTSVQRARTAANVRSMLAGFKAGVERGRTSPSASRPVQGGPGLPQQRPGPNGGRDA